MVNLRDPRSQVTPLHLVASMTRTLDQEATTPVDQLTDIESEQAAPFEECAKVLLD
eukprot:CAMPEP_0184315744 /NCGR_PEP_ID=MMETSP1049-20130417/85238_1 /TAXON_ID=77928 /ORGANISM="Proteomonas sulcata, Strain CCMP704" /LENGTH=55 /DNA_ID=CAMNT_0026634413 /DNA_START=37 /DNA_END=201 /DNA_ORIENTATION=+